MNIAIIKMVTALMLLTLTANANTAFEVVGELRVQGHIENAFLPKLEIITTKGKLIVDDVRENIYSCKKGKFEIVDSSFASNGKFTLLSMIECYQETEELVNNFETIVQCPKLILPVCGDTGFALITFSNACELATSSATFVSSGRCE